jgi:hypothetical protein
MEGFQEKGPDPILILTWLLRSKVEVNHEEL